MARFLFEITLAGEGDDAGAAWENAIEAFFQDPGYPDPEAVSVEEIEDEN